MDIIASALETISPFPLISFRTFFLFFSRLTSDNMLGPTGSTEFIELNNIRSG